MATTKRKYAHELTITFDPYGPTYTMECHALHDAPCRARFTCDCERWADQGRTEDGIPWHCGYAEYGDTERHYGEFAPDWCNVVEWFTVADGIQETTGSVVVPVKYAWEGEFFRYEVEAGEQA